MSGVLCRRDQQGDEFSYFADPLLDEQYSCSENEHMRNMGVSGDPYCCDQFTDSTVASLIGPFFEKLSKMQFLPRTSI